MTGAHTPSVADVLACTIPPAGWACTRSAGHDGPCAAITTGEADYRAYRAWAATSPDHAPDGTLEALASCADMLEKFGPDCFPANEAGQVDFARIMMDATVSEIRAYLRANAARATSKEAQGNG